MGAVIFCNIITVILGAASLIIGFRRGLLGFVGILLGIAFGAVTVHIAGDSITEYTLSLFSSLNDEDHCKFAAANIGGAFVMFVVTMIFYLICLPLTTMLKFVPTGLINSIAGSLGLLFISMTALSLVFNFMLCVSPRSELLKSGSQDDANLCEEVLLLAPALMGTPSVKDLSHTFQLLDAKKIS